MSLLNLYLIDLISRMNVFLYFFFRARTGRHSRLYPNGATVEPVEEKRYDNEKRAAKTESEEQFYDGDDDDDDN